MSGRGSMPLQAEAVLHSKRLANICRVVLKGLRLPTRATRASHRAMTNPYRRAAVSSISSHTQFAEVVGITRLVQHGDHYCSISAILRGTTEGRTQS